MFKIFIVLKRYVTRMQLSNAGVRIIDAGVIFVKKKTREAVAVAVNRLLLGFSFFRA